MASSAVRTRLELPSTKFLVKHLSESVTKTNHTDIPNLNVWSLYDYLIFSIVWIQGQITQINEETDSFVIDDGSGKADVIGMRTIPAGCVKPQVGRYVMVTGEFVQQNPRPRVKIMKIQDLSRDEIAKASWRFEVQHLHKYLSSC